MASRPVSARPAIGQAPGDLAIVQAFVNTLDIEAATDELARPQALARWLAVAGLVDHSNATKADLTLALDLREALRGVLRTHAHQGHANGGGASPADRPAANPAGDLLAVAASLPTRLDVTSDGRVRAVPADSGLRAGLARILIIAGEAATLGTWTRLKTCSADDCQWAFYDRSPTRNACWCSMQICGSRAKSRAYRQRTALVME